MFLFFYLDMEDLKQRKSDGNFLGGETESRTPFIKSLLGASVHQCASFYFNFIFHDYDSFLLYSCSGLCTVAVIWHIKEWIIVIFMPEGKQ